MKLKGTIIITLISLLERFSYYGVRAILVLYVTDSDVFNLSSETALSFFGYWSAALVIAAVPFSLITDKFLGQKRSIIVGGLLTLAGYLLLIIQNQNILIFSIILILMGISLVKPSTTILIGRQFKKENKTRTLAYMILFMGVNIGAFFGVITLGYIGEFYGWKYGFMLAALSTFFYLSIAYLFIQNLKEVETNELENGEFKMSMKKTILSVLLLALITVVFWKNYEIETTKIILDLSAAADRTLLGYDIPSSMMQAVTSYWVIPWTIVLFIFWYKKGVTNFFKAILISIILLIFGIIGHTALTYFQPKEVLEWSIVLLGFFAFAEVIMSSIITAYVTRIAQVEFSNTIYSVFLLLSYLIGVGFVYLVQIEFQFYLALSTLAVTILGIIIFRQQIGKLTYELK